MDNHDPQNGEPALTNIEGDGVKSMERRPDGADPLRDRQESFASLLERYSVREEEKQSALTSRIKDLQEKLSDLALQVEVLQQAFSKRPRI